MSKLFIEDRTFEKVDFSKEGLTIADYENCVFHQCNFENMDISNIKFSDCQFTGCNLCLAEILKTAFQNVKFKDCKMLGLHFQNCNQFLLSLDFEYCTLNLSSFYKLKLKKTSFKNSSLQEVDFSETDMSGSSFENCDLAGAVFDTSNLEKADLRTSYNYSINPELNRIRKAKFSMSGIIGLLDKYDIEVE